MEIGVFAKIFGFAPSFTFSNTSSLTVEPAKLTGSYFRDDVIDKTMLPTTGQNKTKDLFEDKKNYATVYIISAVFTAAQLKITDSHNRAITFTSGEDVKSCSTPEGSDSNKQTAKNTTSTSNTAGTDKSAASEKAAVNAAAATAPGGGGKICQDQTGVVQIDTPEGTPVAMRVYRLWWYEGDKSWNLARDENKNLPTF